MNQKRPRHRLAAMAAFVSAVSAAPAVAGPGDIDVGFGRQGFVSLPGIQEPVAVLPLEDGSSLVIGNRGNIGSSNTARTVIQTILISAAPVSQPAERLAVARLATALRAPVITLGVRQGTDGFAQQTWTSSSFAALDLAGDLVDGVPLPTVSATFRVRIDAPGTFVSGSLLEGALFLETDICPMGCWEFPLEFAVEVP